MTKEEELALQAKKKKQYKMFFIGGSFIILSTLVIFAIKQSKKG
jgi:hypothetical protein